MQEFQHFSIEATHDAPPFSAWDPGVESPIPAELRPLTTLLRPENVETSWAEARELRAFTGLDWPDLVAFRPERLALHEVLIRVSADLSVPEGEKVVDLGVNFRDMTRRLLARLSPGMPALAARHAELGRAVDAILAPALRSLDGGDAQALAAKWSGTNAGPPLERATMQALGRVLSAVLVRHGRLWGPREVIASVARRIVLDTHGAEQLGRWLEPGFLDAARAEGFALLPSQAAPLVMNTKGASASGKTTIRPLQRRLAAEIGADWSQFALISPDIWRKQLLDYGSLGEAYKYAGAFTGEELRIVDQKLDAYMARKAEDGRMPHLLIDRFRFDSFAPHSDEAGSNLLTRFGRTVYLFFMVTHPASLVERAWHRGLEVGRYKAVDDTLAHAVEAYSGMPQLFFTWVRDRAKRVHFEFLDNEVPEGRRPLTAAYGWNDEITILDARPLVDVERFRRIDVDARSPEELFPDATALAEGSNRGFLDDCLRNFRRVRFARRETGRAFREIVEGKARDVDEALPAADRRHTVGRWSEAED